MDINISSKYFLKLIDKEGFMQFCHGQKKAHRFGYAIEDQARALIVSVMLDDKRLIKLFSQLILRARAPKNGLRMIWGKNGLFDKKEDYFGEASGEVLWALGWLKGADSNRFNDLVNYLYQGVALSDHSRVSAYSILGLVKMGDKKKADYLAKRLVEAYQKNASVKWPWFEDKLFYANALKPWALLEAGQLLKNDQYLKIGLASLNFLIKNSKYQSMPSVVGNRGWWEKGRPKALYDQQPIDVSYTVLALLSAYRIFGEKFYLDQALFFYSWFHGNNSQGVRMVDGTGACFDGLGQNGVNTNCGGESSVVYLMAGLELKRLLTNVKSNLRAEIQSLANGGILPQKNPHVAGFLELLT